MIWLVLGGAAVLVLGASMLIRARLRSGRLDVGSVSDHWIAEHRADKLS